MLKTFKYRLHPNQEQDRKLHRIVDECRGLYNAMLEQRRFAYGKRGISLNYSQQANELPRLKKELPHFKDISSQSLQDVARRLDKAFQAFFRRLKTDQKAGFPRFQGQNRYNSFTYPQSGFSLNGKFVTLSKVGHVRIKCHR